MEVGNLIPGLSGRMAKGWKVITLEAMRNNAYTKGMKFSQERIVYKEYPEMLTSNKEQIENQKNIIWKNLLLVERVVKDYNHLLDFQNEISEGFLTRDDTNRLLHIMTKYHEFLKQNIGDEVFINKRKASLLIANTLYNQTHKDFYNAYKKSKAVGKTTRFTRH